MLKYNGNINIMNFQRSISSIITLGAAIDINHPKEKFPRIKKEVNFQISDLLRASKYLWLLCRK